MFNKYKLMYEEMEEKYLKVLHDFKDELQKEEKYIGIKTFDVRDREFVRKISVVHESEEMKFMLYDLRQQCVERMVEGNVEVNTQMTGVLKGIDLVVKNLSGYDNIWKSIVEQENRNVPI